MQAIGRVWWSLPTWGKWVAGIAAVVLIDAIGASIGERRFVAAVAENFAARILYYGTPLGGSALGALAGIRIHRHFQSDWMAWSGGVIVALGAIVALGIVTSDIPGVGWRIKQARDSGCYVDWDGRANPTVCD